MISCALEDALEALTRRDLGGISMPSHHAGAKRVSTLPFSSHQQVQRTEVRMSTRARGLATTTYGRGRVLFHWSSWEGQALVWAREVKLHGPPAWQNGHHP